MYGEYKDIITYNNILVIINNKILIYYLEKYFKLKNNCNNINSV